MALSFLYPKFLLLLILVPLFIFVYFFSILYNKKKAVMFANFEAMERFYEIEFFSKNFLALYLNVFILILLIFSLAGTSYSFRANSSTFSYAVVVDDSSSMSSTDILPNRLEAAKKEASNFINMLPVGVDVGIISFSGDANILQGLDSSKIKAKMAIDQIEYGKIQGTNVYNALISANKLFGNKKMKSVVLISDGQINIADTPQIIRYVKKNNLVVNTIAVGTEEGGKTEFNVISKVDKDFLKALAFNSGGKFFMANNGVALKESFSSLVDDVNREVTIDLTLYLLLAAIILFSILWVLYNLRFKVVP